MILTKATILHDLKTGKRIRYGRIRYGSIYYEIVLVDEKDEIVGTVRYDTFLRLCQDKVITKSKSSYMYDYYIYNKEEKNNG